MAANTPVPTTTVLLPGVEFFLADIRRRFVPNRYGLLDDKDFLEVFELAAKVFADWRHLSVKQVKGATYPVPYTDNLDLVPPDYRLLGMQAVAIHGVDSATGAAGVRADPVYFTLLRDSAGPVQALLDAEAESPLAVKARWVLASGSAPHKIASFDELVLEDYPYAAGDVRRYTFPDGQTRLVQWKADSVGFQHPVPTGRDDDPIYRLFAPPAGGVASAELAALAARVQLLEANSASGPDPDALPAPLVGGVRTVTVNFALDVVPVLKNGRGFSGPNTGPSDRNYLRGNWRLLSYGSDAAYKTFANADSYALIRKDYLVSYVAEQLQADEFEVFVTDANKLVALAAAGVTAVTETNDFWFGRVMYDEVNYSGVTYRWECAISQQANAAKTWCWFRTRVQ